MDKRKIIYFDCKCGNRLWGPEGWDVRCELCQKITRIKDKGDNNNNGKQENICKDDIVDRGTKQD